MNKENKKLQKHLIDEIMKVSKTNPDVIIYIEALMKKYEELEQENINIKQQLLENKISLKDVEYQEKIKYKNIIDELDDKLCSTWQLYYDHSRLTTFKCEDMLYLIEQIRKDINELKEGK